MLHGLLKGLKLAFWLAVLGSLALISFHYLKVESQKFTTATDESAEDHHSIRRNIAMAYADKQGAHTAGQTQTRSSVSQGNEWKTLTSVGSDDGSGFGSHIVVHQRGDILYYRVIVGPYDPDISRALKAAPGWVDMVVFDSLGRRIPGIEEGIRIPFSSLEFHQSDGRPLGWLATGAVQVRGLEPDAAHHYQLGWMLPDSIRLAAQR